jgi:hypothetical protein
VFLGSISFTHALLSNKIVAAAVAATSPRSHARSPLILFCVYAFDRRARGLCAKFTAAEKQIRLELFTEFALQP